jgi:hypothetical protein
MLHQPEVRMRGASAVRAISPVRSLAAVVHQDDLITPCSAFAMTLDTSSTAATTLASSL